LLFGRLITDLWSLSGWPVCREIAAQFGIGDRRVVRPGRDNQRYQTSSDKEDTHLTSPFSAAKAVVFGALCVFSSHDMRAVNLRCAHHHKKALYGIDPCPPPLFNKPSGRLD